MQQLGIQPVIDSIESYKKGMQDLVNDLIIADQTKDIFLLVKSFIQLSFLCRDLGKSATTTARLTSLLLSEEDAKKLEEWIHEEDE